MYQPNRDPVPAATPPRPPRSPLCPDSQLSPDELAERRRLAAERSGAAVPPAQLCGAETPSSATSDRTFNPDLLDRLLRSSYGHLRLVGTRQRGDSTTTLWSDGAELLLTEVPGSLDPVLLERERALLECHLAGGLSGLADVSLLPQSRLRHPVLAAEVRMTSGEQLYCENNTGLFLFKEERSKVANPDGSTRVELSHRVVDMRAGQMAAWLASRLGLARMPRMDEQASSPNDEPSQPQLRLYDPARRFWRPVDQDELTTLVQQLLDRTIRVNGLKGLEVGMQASARRVQTLVDAVRRASLPQLFNSQEARYVEDNPTELAFNVGGWAVRLVRRGQQVELDSRPACREDHFTAMVDVDYDPSADCPDWTFFMHHAYGHQDGIVPMLQKWLGQALVGRTVGYGHLLCCHGPSNGGKSTLAKAVQRLLGSTTEFDTARLGERFSMSGFGSARMLVGNDTSAGFLQRDEAGWLKALTGGDLVVSEVKGLNRRVGFRGNKLIMMCSNHPISVSPQCADDFAAWAQRLIYARCEHNEEVSTRFGSDTVVDRVLRDEAPGLVNWLVEGLRLLMEDCAVPANRGRMVRPDDLRAEFRRLAGQADLCSAFCQRYLVFDPDAEFTLTELRDAMEMWGSAKGYDTKKRIRNSDLNGTVMDQFSAQGVKPCNSLVADGRAARGFRRVRLLTQQAVLDANNKDVE